MTIGVQNHEWQRRTGPICNDLKGKRTARERLVARQTHSIWEWDMAAWCREDIYSVWGSLTPRMKSPVTSEQKLTVRSSRKRTAESNQMSRPYEDSMSKAESSWAHPGERCFLRGTTWNTGDNSPSKQVRKESLRNLCSQLKDFVNFRQVNKPAISPVPFQYNTITISSIHNIYL